MSVLQYRRLLKIRPRLASPKNPESQYMYKKNPAVIKRDFMYINASIHSRRSEFKYSTTK